MNKRYKPLALTLAAAAALLVSFYFDAQIAGKVPQSAMLAPVARLMSFVGNGGLLLAVSLALYLFGRFTARAEIQRSGRLAVFSVILSGVVTHLLKAAFERPRVAHAADSMTHLLEHPSLFDLTGRFNSFPSGHALTSFAVAYVLATRFPRYKIIFYATAVLVAASRVYLGSHYPSDVAAGALIGLGVGWLVAGKVRGRFKWLIAFLILLAVFISFFKSGNFLLFDVDEAVFSEASREMVETGELITPTYNYEPRYDKPVLFYWFQSMAFVLGGVSEGSARFVSGFFGVLLVSMTFLFTRKIKGDLAAVFASLALLLNIAFFIYTHSAVTDMTLAFFITASLYAFYLGSTGEGGRWFALAWGAAALAVLTKGAIGLLIPGATAFFYILASKKFGLLRTALKPAYVLIFLVIAVPWFAAQSFVNGWEFYDAFVVKHHLERYSGVISSHGGPPYYYVFVLLAGFFPWVAFLPGALWKGIKERGGQANSPGLFLTIWFAFVFVFFTISRTKLPNYIFPLYPASAVLAGLYLSELIRSSAARPRNGLYVLAALSALLAAALFALPSMEVQMDVPLTNNFFYSLGAIFATITVLSLMAFYGALPSLIGVSGVVVVLLVMLRLYALPPANVHLQKTLYDYAMYARACDSPTVLATYEINKPSIAFYAARRVPKIEQRALCNIGEHSKKGRFLVITTPSRYKGVTELEELQVIDKRADYMLLGNTTCPYPL